MTTPGDPADAETRMRRVVLCATEDWFVLSHFKPLLRALRRISQEVVVVTRVSGREGEIAAFGARVVPFDYERSSTNAPRVLATALRLRGVLAREKPDAVHLVALKPIVLGTMAVQTLRVPTVVSHVTGLGLIAATDTRYARLMRAIVRTAVRRLSARPGAHVFVENEDDIALLGVTQATLLGGAGVDPLHFSALPEPTGTPAIAYVGRLIHSKGIDVLVEAARRLRASGRAVDLRLYGAIDADNREIIAASTLEAWQREGLIVWHGFSPDVRDVWKSAAIAVFPSLGGEGLPRSLLEAAACARSLIVTDVPGCRRFVRDGIEGLVVPPGDPTALAEAMARALDQPALREQMRAAARQRVLEGYTEAAVEAAIVTAYTRATTSR